MKSCITLEKEVSQCSLQSHISAIREEEGVDAVMIFTLKNGTNQVESSVQIESPPIEYLNLAAALDGASKKLLKQKDLEELSRGEGPVYFHHHKK